MSEQEQWLQIEDFQHYQISSFGNVRKIKKFHRMDNAPLLRNLNGYDRKGYHAFCLTYDIDAVKYVSGHVLVLEAFVCRRPFGYIGHHLDTDTKNNHLTNLEWSTPSNNIKQAYIVGNLNQKGSKNNGSILIESEVVSIKNILSTGKYTHSKIGEMFGVARSTISQINTGLNWGYLEV